MSNRLSRETSPYLLQHKNNPVDWYAWGDEALTRARMENRPILLSVGYSACHWCHVMEHESFENPETARLMNENFVCIKVDREERPDLDQIYQNVAQAMTRSGGWPLTVFLTPELKPFFGGTYFPPEDRWGRPGFPRLLQALSTAYREDKASVLENADKLVEFIRRYEDQGSVTDGCLPDIDSLKRAAQELLSGVDWTEGGFAGAPKFPNTPMIDFLWRIGISTEMEPAREAALLALEKMARGGIYDQLGGGFHRYSVDETWSVPHFEKMLYDNALLLRSYAQVLLTADIHGSLGEERRELFVRILEETVDYLLREMRSPEGAFFSAQDADSEGEEGKFFVWDTEDLFQHLTSEEASAFARRYGVNESGNFEHRKTVLFLAERNPGDDLLVESSRRKLFTVRSKRIPPLTDDKTLASWNGLLISGLAWASRALAQSGRAESADRAWDAATGAFSFLSQTLARPDSRLWSTFKGGTAKLNAYLDDYAFLAMAALDLSRFSAGDCDLYLSHAERWIGVVIKHFSTPKSDGYYFTSDDHEALIQRPRSLYDPAIPSGTAVVLQCLLALAEIDRDGRSSLWSQEAERQMRALFPKISARPYAHGELLNAAFLAAQGAVAISGEEIEIALNHPHCFRKSGKERMICHQKTCRRWNDLAELNWTKSELLQPKTAV